MATLGNTGSSDSASYEFPRSYLCVLLVTATETGYITSISVRIQADAETTNSNFRVGIWNSSGTLLAYSDYFSVPAGAGTQWYTGNITSTVITNGSSYYLGVVSNNSTDVDDSANLRIGSSGAGTDGGVISMSYSTPTDFTPASLISKDYDAVIYATYTPTFVLGNDTAGGSYRSLGAAAAIVYKVTVPSSINIQVESLYFYGRGAAEGDATQPFKAVIWDNSNAVVSNGVSPEFEINDTAAWKSVAYSTKPILLASTDYYIGVIAKYENINSGAIVYYTGANANNRVGDNNYTTPTTLSLTGNAYDFNIYITYSEYSVAPPNTPTATSATSVGQTSFTATWNTATGATKYYLDVATDSGFTSMLYGYDNLDVGNVLSKAVTGLTKSTTYYYRVRAYNLGGTSASSNTITTTTNEYAASPSAITAALDKWMYIAETNIPTMLGISRATTQLSRFMGYVLSDYSQYTIPTMGDLGFWFGGNTTSSTLLSSIDYKTISNNSNATKFGDMLSTGGGKGVSNGGNNRAVIHRAATLEYITCNTAGNSVSFGNSVNGNAGHTNNVSNGYMERGIWGGGYSTGAHDHIEYVTINTTSNSFDFGNLSVARTPYGCGASNNTRGVFAGGWLGSGPSNTIDYVTITTAANAVDLADLSGTQYYGNGGCDNGTNDRALFSFGTYAGSFSARTDYFTISTNSNSANFGNLSLTRCQAAMCSNRTNERALCGGGATATNNTGQNNRIDYYTINSASTATDLCDLATKRNWHGSTSNA